MENEQNRLENTQESADLRQGCRARWCLHCIKQWCTVSSVMWV